MQLFLLDLILEHMVEELISGTRRKEAKLIFTLE